MFLTEPQRTAWDLNFSVLGFPVRVHPLFWLFGLLAAGVGDARLLVLWLLVDFVSILIHELGHALMMRRYGRPAYIVLYMLGGLAIEGSPNPYETSWHPRGDRRRTPQEQIYISLAGPVAQLLLAGLIVIFVKVMGGEVVPIWGGILPDLVIKPSLQMSVELTILLNVALWFNVWWALVNLLPVYPLDGGQIAMAYLTMRDAWGGQVRTIQLSMIVGIAAAIFFLMEGNIFTAMLFGSLAISNYMAYTQIHGRGGDRW